MHNQNLNTQTPKTWSKKLAYLVGLAGVSTLIAVPAIAQFYPKYALFQPYAYSSYPYRNSKSSIADTLARDSKFANLVYELKDSGLLNTLKQKGPFTILAPTDAAFNALPDEIFKRYSQPENRLKVLKYHLVAGRITPQDIDGGKIATLEGKPIQVTVNDSTVKLNDANGMHPSTVAENGVIIQIDKVLLPPDF